MISNRAFAIAVCVFLGIAWSYKVLVPSREKPSEESVRLLEMNHCLAYSDTVLRIRFLDYRTYFNTLIDRKSMPVLHFAGFSMGSGDRYSTNGKPSPCTFYLREIHKASSPLEIAANAYVQAYDKLRPQAREVEQLYARRYP
ncbi:hypothetical protein ALQ04_03505 [Pseudomonas cichorii]|uniref:Uncharacterized protein n=1 Tax=Pseudomonas cichorii TaxID=36746 RepID=A0A3M4M8H2_PSECI|nr:hypothetical protein [Pseudomonas cichorii]RMQ49461.1 hypothetical protein ALQ04_03505 [Pseudomonas cichorii]